VKFEPKGERAWWRTIYEMMRALDHDAVLTYEDMAEALSLDPVADRSKLQMAARRAGLELERADRRAADAVRNVGYRIVQPTEILGLGKRRNRRAGSQIRRGSTTVKAVDLSAVDGETRNALEILARGFAIQQEINERVLTKQREQDDMLSRLTSRVDALEQRD